MFSKKSNTYWAKIYMGGDLQIAKHICREFCMTGLCINISETDYIYTMGSEKGFVVEFINYPRFPSTEDDILNTAYKLGSKLMEGLFQGSYTIMTPKETYWFTRRDADNK